MKDKPLWLRMSIGLLGFLLSSVVGLIVLVVILNQTILNRDFAQDVFSSRLGYELFGQALGRGIQGENQEPGDIQTTEDVFTDYVSFDTYQANAETVSNGIYDWLEGSAQTIEFELDLVGTQTEFRSMMEDLLRARMDSLPPCETTAAARQAATAGFEAECRPEGLADDPAQILQQSVSDNELNELYETATIRSENVVNEADIAESEAPNGYELLRGLPLILTFVAVAIILLAAALLRHYSDIMQFTGRNLLRPSLAILVVGLLLLLAFDLPSRLVGLLDNTADISAGAVEQFSSLMRSRFVGAVLISSGIPFAAGLVLYIAGRKLKPFEYRVKTDHVTHEANRARFPADTPEEGAKKS